MQDIPTFNLNVSKAFINVFEKAGLDVKTDNLIKFTVNTLNNSTNVRQTYTSRFTEVFVFISRSRGIEKVVAKYTFVFSYLDSVITKLFGCFKMLRQCK